MDEQTALTGISIYPAFFKSVIEPGSKYRFQISITNNEPVDITVNTTVDEFSQSDNNSNVFSISDKYDDWFSAERLVIKSGKTEVLNVDLEGTK